MYKTVLLLPLLFATITSTFSTYQVYDYIVAGGGGAGSLWASRLSETKYSVLVLEQGPNATCYTCDNTIVNEIDDLWTSHGNSQFTTPQTPVTRSFRQIKMSWPGGNTRIYQGVAYPAHPKVYDQYPGNLTYETFLPYYAKFQNHFCNYLNESVTGINAADCLKYHGSKGGPMGIGRPVTGLSDSEFFRDILASAPELGVKFVADPWNGREIQSSPANVYYQQLFRRVAKPTDPSSSRVRESTYSGYTPYKVLARKNLTYKTETQVVRLIFRDEVNRGDFGLIFLAGFPATSSPKTQVVGVLYTNGDQSYAVFARKQVVLSAGVLGSPKILQQSGVGPADLLASLGVPLVANNKYIGQNVAEHPGFSVVYKCKKQLPYNLVNFGGIGTMMLTTPYAKHGYPDVQIQLFPTFPVTSLESTEGISPLQLVYPPTPVANDTTSLGGAPILNFIICRTDPAVRGSFNITGTQYRYTSELDLGWSTDFATYGASEDYLAQQWVVDFLRTKLLNSSNAFAKKWIDTELQPGIVSPAQQGFFDLQTNAYKADLLYHQTGGVNLGTATDIYGSVNGISGVTVCDNSLQPHPPNQNPTAPMLALCEYVADKLIQRTATSGAQFLDQFLPLGNAAGTVQDDSVVTSAQTSLASAQSVASMVTISCALLFVLLLC